MRLGPAEVRWTAKTEGDLRAWPGRDDPDVEERRRRVVDRPWSWLHQVHGERVHAVRYAGDRAGEDGDALVSAVPGAVLAVLTADCAPLALASPEGVVGAVHAGWRGLRAGVVAEAVAAMRSLGATSVTAALGPCIHPECYEFSPADLEAAAESLGDGVRGGTADGRPAFDLPAAVKAAAAAAGAEIVHDEDVCTACSDDYFSYRARGDVARQAMAVWRTT